MFVCVDRSGCRLAHSTAGPLQTPLPQTPLSGQELQHQKQVLPVLIVTLYCSCVCVCVRVCVYVWTRGCMHCICQLGCTRLWFYFRPHKRLPLLGPKARRQQEMTRASSYSLVSVFVSTLSVRRVLDEVLQKLVQLIQEEDCVSEKRGRCPHSLKDTVRCRVNSSPAPGSLH